MLKFTHDQFYSGLYFLGCFGFLDVFNGFWFFIKAWRAIAMLLLFSKFINKVLLNGWAYGQEAFLQASLNLQASWAYKHSYPYLQWGK